MNENILRICMLSLLIATIAIFAKLLVRRWIAVHLDSSVFFYLKKISFFKIFSLLICLH
jgi:hypothetical protein